VEIHLELSGPPFASHRHRDELAALKAGGYCVFYTNRNFPISDRQSADWHMLQWQGRIRVCFFPHQTNHKKMKKTNDYTQKVWLTAPARRGLRGSPMKCASFYRTNRPLEFPASQPGFLYWAITIIWPTTQERIVPVFGIWLNASMNRFRTPDCGAGFAFDVGNVAIPAISGLRFDRIHVNDGWHRADAFAAQGLQCCSG